VCGLILDTVTRGRVEAKRLRYLSIPIRFNPIRTDDELVLSRRMPE